MRVIGLDVGERRTGVASGDTETGLAVPVGVIESAADGPAVAEVVHEAQAREASVIVVGMPYSMSGRVGPQAETVGRFVEMLRAAVDIEVETVDERLSTAQAERDMTRSRGRFHQRAKAGRRLPKGASDAAAAAIILQSWLDRRRGAPV